MEFSFLKDKSNLVVILIKIQQFGVWISFKKNTLVKLIKKPKFPRY